MVQAHSADAGLHPPLCLHRYCGGADFPDVLHHGRRHLPCADQIFGANAPDLLSDPKLFPALIVGQNIWKETGYGTIIYLAALSSVDVQLYEAAKIDGAGRWQLMWHVTLPAIRGTIVLMLIMKVGQLLNTSYEQIFLMQNSMNRAASDVFDTYVYTKGITGGQYSLATATGLFKSTISMLMVVTANKIAKLCGESGLY